MEINMAKAFSPVPLGRHREDGKKSGEAFREDILCPQIAEAVKSGDVVVVTLDGMAGLPASFLEEAFGGLVRVNGFAPEELDKVLNIRATEKYFSPYIEDIRDYIREAAA